MSTPSPIHRHAAPNPWYREPWPWLLMAGPAIVVVAGFLTLGFAIQSSDGLVADDYYKQGKAINMTLHRDARAQELGYRARVSLSPDGRIALTFAEAAPATPQLRLTLHHPTRSGFDREVFLARAADGSYNAAMPAIDSSRWSMTLEDAGRAWRLTGDWSAGSGSIELGGSH
ncbi:MAG: FixH family protein [Betaproteobacteria bacterium]